jgi:xylulokinase
MARAVMEGICFENRRALDLLARPADGTVLRCTGGGSRSALWNQLRADIYERPVRSFATVEGGIHGAAMLAAVGAGWYANTAEAADNLGTPGADWQPRPSTAGTYRAGYESFRAVHDALDGQWKHWAR